MLQYYVIANTFICWRQSGTVQVGHDTAPKFSQAKKLPHVKRHFLTWPIRRCSKRWRRLFDFLNNVPQSQLTTIFHYSWPRFTWPAKVSCSWHNTPTSESKCSREASYRSTKNDTNQLLRHSSTGHLKRPFCLHITRTQCSTAAVPP